MQTPLLFIGDSPESNTGLGRIGKDLALIASRMPEFRVGYFGRGSNGTRKLPFQQYSFGYNDQWGENQFEAVWKDFVGSQKGIVMTVWDASRLFWITHPDYLPQELDGLRKLLNSDRITKWGYFPVDATGPNNRLSALGSSTIARFERTLAYSKFGQEIIESSDFIPHPIDTSTFHVRDKEVGRSLLGVEEDVTLIGVVMTNQARKDWGLWAQIAALIPDVEWWLHVDRDESYWSLNALLQDFNLGDRVHITYEASELQMAFMYAACDLTILPSLGEGFGYPIAESLACGVPVIHHSYGAGHEIIPDSIPKIKPELFRLDTINNVYRPVFSVASWVDTIITALARLEEWPQEFCEKSVAHLNVENLRPVWERWFRQGVNGQNV